MTPQLRFPEFTDDWHVKKLGELGKFTSGVGFTNSEQGGKHGTPFYKVSDMNLSGNTNEMTQANNYVSDTQVIDMKYKPIIDKSIIFAKVGAAIFLERKRVASNFLIDNNMMAFTPNGNLDFQYIKIVFDRLHLSKMAQVGALPSYNGSDLAIIKVQLPSHKEQEKIADFLTAVDERIRLGEQKRAKLDQYKRGVMQQIFSQKIRFKDENGNEYPEWEEKKLSDVLKERNTQTPISGEYPLMAFVAYKGVAPKGDRYNREFLVSDAKSKKYKQTQLGDFIYSSNNLETGSIGLNLYGSASISPVYSIFETKDGYSHQFLGAYLTRKKFIYQMVRYRQGVVYGQWRIHESEFLKIEEKFPCTGEQQKIAAFLATLDEKITAEKSKLTAAKKFKKALLQRMFV